MKKQIKNEYKGKILGNSRIGQFKVDELTEDIFEFISKQGFAHIFEEVCEKCLATNCMCEYTKIAEEEIKNYKEFKPKSRGKKDDSN